MEGVMAGRPRCRPPKMQVPESQPWHGQSAAAVQTPELPVSRPALQNFTITDTTITTSSSVGTSFISR
jgi:hypothetical protein